MKPMIRRETTWRLITGLLLLTLLIVSPAFGDEPDDNLSQTWPSRTPTSSAPPAPTSAATPEPGSTPVPATVSPGVGPTSVPEIATITPAAPGTLQPSESGLIQFPLSAEVGECGLPPLVVALGEVNVRSGPGIEFESIGELGFQDERPIIGRAATAAWWQIFDLVDQPGWVSDQAVAVAGFTGAVPITYGEIGIGGQDEWRPTPNPRCTPPPQDELALSEGLVATLLTSSTSTPVVENRPANENATVTPSTNNSSPTSAPLPQDDDQPFNLAWLLVIGAVLIIAGSLALVVQRLRQ